ncbi:MAG: lysozyme inhibitor LprI family protein, partial [Pseudomonadota bacterium]
MNDQPGGSTTVGMGACLYNEAEWWDGQLNSVYTKLAQREKQSDAENKADGITHAPEKFPRLRDMQRQWIMYRDAIC